MSEKVKIVRVTRDNIVKKAMYEVNKKLKGTSTRDTVISDIVRIIEEEVRNGNK
jgi:hypothetical protein